MPLPVGTRGTYQKHTGVVLANTSDKYAGYQLVQFKDDPKQFSLGWTPDEEDVKAGIPNTPGFSYLWMKLPEESGFEVIRNLNGYHCVECHNHNKWAEANLTEDRHICFSCRSSYSWRYDGQFVGGSS